MRKIAKDKIDIFALFITIILFSYFFFFTEVTECGDSFQYLHQHPMREPVYSLLMQFLQTSFGSFFNIALSLFQNLLAILCIYWTYKRVSSIFQLNNFARICSISLLLFPHILTPLASRARLVLTTTIMTEGITYSLYYVWFAIILGIITDYYNSDDKDKNERSVTKKSLNIAYIISFVLSLVLALTRGQMQLCIIVWMLVVSFKAIVNKNYKSIILFVVLAALAFPTKSQLTKWYNLAETGYYVDTISSKPMLLANILYVCDENDIQYIVEDDLRNAFSNMLHDANRDALTIDYATGNVIDRALHHEDCHEPLNFEYIDPEIRKVIEARNGTNASQFFSLMIQEDELCAQISSQLLPNVFTKYLKNYFVIITLGFVRSIAIEKSFIPIVAVVIYIFAILLTLWNFKQCGLNKYSLSMLLVLLCICGTVCGTSLVIECIHRYMIYNFPFFYITGLAMLINSIKLYTSKKAAK